MGITETAIIYLILGTVVACAMQLRAREQNAARRIATFFGAVVFWPIFAPFLLGGSETAEAAPAPRASAFAPRSATEARIHETELGLLGALKRLDGVAEEVLQPEVQRVRGLVVALRGMAKRLEEMDTLLKTPEFSEPRAATLLAELEARSAGDDPRIESVRARIKNIERLVAMRARLFDDLERAMLKMDEISSQMLLLKFVGRPEVEVVHMIKEIAASVEGVAEGLFDTA